MVLPDFRRYDVMILAITRIHPILPPNDLGPARGPHVRESTTHHFCPSQRSIEAIGQQGVVFEQSSWEPITVDGSLMVGCEIAESKEPWPGS